MILDRLLHRFLRPRDTEKCQLWSLIVFDDVGYGRTARLALKRALVMIRVVRPEPNEPHGHCAPIALRVVNLTFDGSVLRFFQSDPSLLSQAGAQKRLSVISA